MMRALLVLCSVFLLFGCSSKKEKGVTSEIESFTKSDAATSKIEGTNVPYCIWYDPNKWLITSTPFYSMGSDKPGWDWILVLIDSDKRKVLSETTPTRGTLALIYSDQEKKRSEEQIKKRVQESLFKGKNLEEFEDLGSQERLVNGLKVFSWKFKTKIPNLGERIFYNYYYSGEKGSVSLVTLTNVKDWSNNEKDLEELLNGLCMKSQ